MSDFFQTGVVATIHRLGSFDQKRMEHELLRISASRPVALVLPALYTEFEKPAMLRILEHLRGVKYLREIIVTLGRTDPEEFKMVFARLEGFETKPILIWNDGPRLQALYRKLQENDLFIGEDGKGRSCWMAYGYVLASGQCDVIALHDCDVLTYDREFLARLIYPVANPDIDYEFCKGYYARVTNRLHGRVTRLLLTPLIRALERMLGYQPLLVYLDSFRYPLAGEFAMKTDLARINRIPSDWGLEIGVLAEIYRNCNVQRVCQVELCENYEHKHQELSAGDPSHGLMKMAIDISKALFRSLAAEGITLTSDMARSLSAKYVRTAENMIPRYHADALINGLEFDRHEEETAVAAFAKAIQMATENFLQDPLGIPLIPNWSRITSALPDFLHELKEAVTEDNRVGYQAWAAAAGS